MKAGWLGLALAVVRDLRQARRPATAEEIAAFETDVLAGFVLARSAAGLSDDTIRGDVGHLDQVRTWFGRPLWGMEPADADAYFGKVLRDAAKGTRLGRAQALRTAPRLGSCHDPVGEFMRPGCRRVVRVGWCGCDRVFGLTSARRAESG